MMIPKAFSPNTRSTLRKLRVIELALILTAAGMSLSAATSSLTARCSTLGNNITSSDALTATCNAGFPDPITGPDAFTTSAVTFSGSALSGYKLESQSNISGQIVPSHNPPNFNLSTWGIGSVDADFILLATGGTGQARFVPCMHVRTGSGSQYNTDASAKATFGGITIGSMQYYGFEDIRSCNSGAAFIALPFNTPTQVHLHLEVHSDAGNIQGNGGSANASASFDGGFLADLNGDHSGAGQFTLTELVAAVPESNDAFQVRSAANLDKGDSFLNITNAGTMSGSDPAGRICVNIYTFDPAEELISCCACSVTPNGLASLSVRNDLVGNTLTAGAPASVTIKLLASTPTGGTCNAASPTSANLVRGMRAWSTAIHASTGIPLRYDVTETPFAVAVLSPSELAKLGSFCGFIQANGSGFGVCNSCRGGALGAAIR